MVLAGLFRQALRDEEEEHEGGDEVDEGDEEEAILPHPLPQVAAEYIAAHEAHQEGNLVETHDASPERGTRFAFASGCVGQVAEGAGDFGRGRHALDEASDSKYPYGKHSERGEGADGVYREGDHAEEGAEDQDGPPPAQVAERAEDGRQRKLGDVEERGEDTYQLRPRVEHLPQIRAQ